MKFNEFNLSADLLAEIEKAGFVEASPIQEQTIPLALYKFRFICSRYVYFDDLLWSWFFIDSSLSQ